MRRGCLARVGSDGIGADHPPQTQPWREPQRKLCSAPHRHRPPAHRPANPRIRHPEKATGKTTKDILRCLKRAIAREVYHLITNPPTPIDISHLRPTRQAARLTLAAAARDLHCSIATLSYIERGRSSNREKIIAYRDYLTSQQDAA